MSPEEPELFRALLYLQNLAKKGHAASPAEVFLGHTVWTPLQPQTRQAQVSWDRHRAERIADQERMRVQYNKTATRTAKDFSVGTNVLAHNVRGKAVRAIVVDGRDAPRSYLVEFPNGSRSYHNRKFLTSIPRQPQSSSGRTSPTTIPTTPEGRRSPARARSLSLILVCEIPKLPIFRSPT